MYLYLTYASKTWLWEREKKIKSSRNKIHRAVGMRDKMKNEINQRGSWGENTLRVDKRKE